MTKSQSKDNVRLRGVINQRKWHTFWCVVLLESVSVELLKVKKYPQTRKIFKVFESDN